MATSAANIRIGAATVYIDTYVSSGTLATGTDVGHHKVPVEIGNTIETVKIEGERSTYPITIEATKGGASIKVAMQEITQSNMVTFLQGTASGTNAVQIGNAAITYKQLRVVRTNGGTTDTWVFWKTSVASKEPLKIGKSEEQALSVTFEALYDDSVTRTDKIGYWSNA